LILVNGTLYTDDQLPKLLASLETQLNAVKALPPISPELVISALEELGQRLDRGELDEKIRQYAPPGALEQLGEIRHLLRRETLEEKLQIELGHDLSPQPRPFGYAIPMPLGTLLHVAAGNVTGLPAFSVVEGLLTGNINLLKLPRQDKGLSLAILLELVDQQPKLAPYICAFDIPSSDAHSLEQLAQLSDGIVVWGGDEAVRAIRALAPPGCKLMEWGHRLSFAYVCPCSGMEGELSQLAHHIISTGGLLCSSCQVVYLDTEDMAQAKQFCLDFLPLLSQAQQTLHTTPGTAGQAALYAWEAQLEQVVDRAGREELFFPGTGCSITLRRDRELELSHLHGNVLVKLLPRRELMEVLQRQKGRLQTAGLLCPEEERAELTALLCRAGVTRITRAGSMSRTFPGEGHDGEYPLRRYLRMVDVEL